MPEKTEVPEDIRRVAKDEKNTLLTETARAAWADLTRTSPRDRTADDLTPSQKSALAKAWSVEGDGIYHYNAYDEPKGGSNSNALSPGYWLNKDPNHQVEKLFGRGTASWTPDGDLVFNDTYDLDFRGKNLPGVPTNADPDDVKIKSRISARALGLDPKKLWETSNARIQDQWAKLEPVMDKVYKDVQAGRYNGQADSVIRKVQTLQARYNRINSGPYKPETASTLATWKRADVRNLEEFSSLMDKMPVANISTRQAAKAGNARGESKSSKVPKGHNAALDGYSGPRVVINPSTFRNEKDGLCVAFNEAFRILMQVNGFDPVAEPTEKQRKFFSDTAYAHDELQMRRTILARLCTFDTSVTDPTDEQLQEAVEFLDTVLEIGAPQNNFEQRAVERIRTAISQALESGERVSAGQAPAPEGSPEIAAGGAGSSAGGVPEDEEKDSGAEFRENAQAQMDEAAKLSQKGPTAEEQKTQAMAEAAGKAAGDDPFGKSAEMKAAAQEAGFKAEDIAEAQKPKNLMQKNGHYVDAQGRVISERTAKALAEQDVRNAAAQDTNNQQQAPGADMDATQNSPRADSGRIGTTSGIKTPGGRELTTGEAAWQLRKQASTVAWMQRTGRSGNGVADALAQRDERANGLFQNRQTDSGSRDALGRKLDDRGRVIA